MKLLKTCSIQPSRLTVLPCTSPKCLLFAIDKSEISVIISVNSFIWKYHVLVWISKKPTRIHMPTLAATPNRFASKIYCYGSAIKRMRLAKPLSLKMANYFQITCNILGISQNHSEITMSVNVYIQQFVVRWTHKNTPPDHFQWIVIRAKRTAYNDDDPVRWFRMNKITK